jgi:RNA polymerase sigma factor (sigma-70 family)
MPTAAELATRGDSFVSFGARGRKPKGSDVPDWLEDEEHDPTIADIEEPSEVGDGDDKEVDRSGGVDLIKIYLSQISQFPVLKGSAALARAKAVQDGFDQLAHLLMTGLNKGLSTRPLSPRDRDTLSAQFQSADQQLTFWFEEVYTKRTQAAQGVLKVLNQVNTKLAAKNLEQSKKSAIRVLLDTFIPRMDQKVNDLFVPLSEGDAKKLGTLVEKLTALVKEHPKAGLSKLPGQLREALADLTQFDAWKRPTVVGKANELIHEMVASVDPQLAKLIPDKLEDNNAPAGILKLAELVAASDTLQRKTSRPLDEKEKLTLQQGQALLTLFAVADHPKVIELARQVTQNRQELINGNLRMVVDLAKKNRNKAPGVPLMDQIQHGNMGLSQAVAKFDYKQGYQFSTYSTWWIKQALTRGVPDEISLVRHPVYKGQERKRMNEAAQKFYLRHGRPPSTEELAKEMKIDVQKLEEQQRAFRPVFSLDFSPLKQTGRGKGEEGSAIADLLEDTREDTAVDNANAGDLVAFVQEHILKRLTQREREIFIERFGLDGQGERTLKDVGAGHGITRERVRQITARNNKKFLQRFINNPAIMEMLATMVPSLNLHPNDDED